MDLTVEDLQKIRDQTPPDWLDLYARGLRARVAERVRAVAHRVVRHAFRDEVADDVLVNTYDRKALAGTLLANWDEERDVLAYIASPGFVLKKVLDSKRKLCQDDAHTASLGGGGEDCPMPSDPPAPPERATTQSSHLVWRDPAQEITRPLIAAAMQFYERINWKAAGHAGLLRAMEDAIGPPDPLHQLERVRHDAIATIQQDIDNASREKQNARSLHRIRELDVRLDQLHGKAAVMPLAAEHLAELMHVSSSNAYQLIARSTAQAREFFDVVVGDL